ncbi:MAG: hypothetical protein IJ568_03820 [Bacilli bacterium]|nr:hypothetical protein [Bacilli bacterium]
MDETNELLELIYQDTYMASKNLEVLLQEIKYKDNKIKGSIEDILKEYEKYLKITKKLLKSNKVKPRKVNRFALMGAKMKMKKDVKSDNSDSKISDIIIQGLVMGVIDINKRLDNYKKDVNKDVLKLTNDLLKFQQNSIDSLKEYL